MTERWCSGDDSEGGAPVTTKRCYSDDDDAGGGPTKTERCSSPMKTERSSSSDDDDTAEFDINSYVEMYSPFMKITRLLFLAGTKGVSKTTQLKALTMAYRLIKIGDNPGLLRKVLEKHNGLLKNDDTSWLKRADLRFAQRKDYIEEQIHPLFEGIQIEYLRLAFKDLGDFYCECGDLEDARTSYLSMRANSNMETHYIDADMRLLLVSLKTARYEDCLTLVSRARTYGSLDNVNLARVKFASGLAHMAQGKYHIAASEFLRVDFKAGNIDPDVLRPRDAATYGALCSLATFDRLEIKQTIIDNNGNNNGWKILGLAPQLRKCIHAFYERDYSQGLQSLDKLKSNFLLDMYLSCHVETLYTLIRQKALMEYVRPFSCLEMKTMAAAFNTTVDELEEELDALITDNKLQAQIVSHNTAC